MSKEIKIRSKPNLKLYFKDPEVEDIENAEEVRSAKVAELVRLDGAGKKSFLLRSELDSFLEGHKIWTKQDGEKIDEWQKQVDQKLSQLKKGGIKLNEGRKIALEISELRKQMFDRMRKRQMFDDTTVESKAESEYVDYLVYACTVDSKTELHYWDSFEDMKNDKGGEVYNEAYKACIEYIYGYNYEFEKSLPESRWLKKYGFIDDNMYLVDRKTGERVDQDGKPIKKQQDDSLAQLANIVSEIEEEAPFIDDETGEPVVLNNKDSNKSQDSPRPKRKRRSKKTTTKG